MADKNDTKKEVFQPKIKNLYKNDINLFVQNLENLDISPDQFPNIS